MSNIKAEIKKENGMDILVVSIPIAKHASNSGKTTVVASTYGNKTFSEVVVDGKPLTIGVNAYIK